MVGLQVVCGRSTKVLDATSWCLRTSQVLAALDAPGIDSIQPVQAAGGLQIQSHEEPLPVPSTSFYPDL
jgi:hypothetical protein